MVQNLKKRLHTKLIELNIFTLRDMGSDVDRITAKRFGQWATRLYVILFISALAILIFYTIIEPHTLTKNFDEPSFILYNHLRKTYGDELKCRCSKIAFTYNQFVEIEPIFHSGLNPNLTVYEQKDYRQFLSAHLQYLQGLCRLSIQSVNNSIDEFLTSLLVTVELLSEINFENRLNILTEQIKINAPILFSRLLSSTQSILHGNAIISTYGTNFNYRILAVGSRYVYAYTEATIYDDECSCGLSSNCTMQGTLIERNSSRKIPLKGMRMGCTPSQSFLVSTLECFYDQSCLDLIQHYTNYENSLTPLSTTNLSHFSQNTTIGELINNLFIEQWSTQINYASYYQQCSPSICSYTSIEKFNTFHTITVVLGIQGGLTIVLKWICPKLVRIGSKIYHHRKKQPNTVNPINTNQVSSNATYNTAIQNTTWNNKITSMNIRLQNNVIPRGQSIFKMIFVIILLICILVGATVLSVYYARQKPSLCHPAFKQLSITTSCQLKTPGASVIADVNSDNRVDLIFPCQYDRTVNILFGTGNDTFQTTMVISFEAYSWIYHIRVRDMNNDGQVDLILVQELEVTILFGYGNGTFQTQNMQSIAIGGVPQHIAIVDLNHDNMLDIIVIIEFEDYVYIYLANVNGTFLLDSALFITHNSNSQGLIIADFNNDTHLDIAIMNTNSLHIHIFYANTNGSYQPQKWLFTAIDAAYAGVVASDFDSDNRIDIAFLYSWRHTVCMLYQNNNDSFHVNEQIIMESSIQLNSVVVGDLNGDNSLDIVIGTISQYEIYGLLGNGNGDFQIQTIHSNNLFSYQIWNDVTDFNNDNCQDIISINIDTNYIDIFLNTCECSTH
ncbi:unnamed protein product [Rotaria sp. Silwood2]|nr:unnamed protein product [Rotaria sp. Silwood2]CAF2935497.1 unnamed protein product [Rotaria sp. Silwood2]CAF3318938.1 unnamed protein product [Rotaria sp. Silwood2]CAF4069987.1 unnamed protein product [Rotaria sp. Silwood2]CAF4070859.1 unnamed protein product [Rotaria sp. Silwood2]